ncbi:MAG: 8-oxo-dGTP diphosphatase [Patescibacteria group bacterium]|nr:8-oxo-dGTP diphosphatase [Patescibacteria group bacterium]
MKEITATLLFLVTDTKILLAMKKRGFGINRYNGVGGKPEPGETIEQTMIRESIEEIGVTPINFKKIAKIAFNEYLKGEPVIMNMHVFLSDKWSGEPIETEEMAPKWFDKDKVPFEIMWPDDLYWLPQVINEQKLTANFKLDINDKITSHNIKIVDEI